MTENGRYAFFRGCLIPARYPHLEYVARKVLPKMGIRLVDFEEFTCCADPVQFNGVDQLTSLAIAARNICIAEEAGLDILCLCNGCFNSLATANETMKKEPEARRKINNILADIGHQFTGGVDVRHILQVILDDVGLNSLGSHVKFVLRGLKVATHTGCHLTSPEEVLGFDDPIDPTVLDSLVAALGATPVDYDFKALCCGVGFSLAGKTATSSLLLKDKLESMREYDADCIVLGCPFCYQQFDLGQAVASRQHKFDFKLPVLYYPQLLGLAMGYSLEEMQYGAHRVKSEEFERKLEKILLAGSV